LGRYQEALRADEEAVALFRQLTADNSPASQAYFAMALHNLAIEHSRAGSEQGMLAALTEAARIYRELAARDPDLYQADYSRMLGALYRTYNQLGMSTEVITHDLLPPRNKHPESST
jgi:tetratricopeptide (TPR) repeat protein